MSSPAPENIPTASQTITEILPDSGWRLIDLQEVWRYRELVWMLGLRDIKIRYKQTLIGAAWAVIQPLATMVLITVLFRLMGHAPSQSTVPYPVTLFCALLPWQFFASALTQGANSLVVYQNMIKKVYFPRVALPISSMIPGLLDLSVAFIVLIGLMLFYGVVPGWAVILTPLWVLLAVLTALGFSLWLSAANALYRDLIYTLPLVIQLGFFISPVIFETRAIIPEKWLPIFALNPMVAVLEGFRWSLLGGSPPPLTLILPGLLVLAIVLLSGMFYFRRMERYFSDRI
jgi:lipopolysaccharide transport system permease protein